MDQGHNHVFKVGGPIPWSRVLLPFHRKKLDRSTHFGAVDYIITLCSSKSYVKKLGGPDPLLRSPNDCAHDMDIVESVACEKIVS